MGGSADRKHRPLRRAGEEGRCASTGQPSLDCRPVGARRDVLVYQRPILTEDIEVTGPIVFRLWAASDCPDTDWTARLAVVFADGLCVNLTYGIMRARYRNGYDSPALLEPGKPYLYEVNL